MHADGSTTGLSLQMSLQSARPLCVQEFCEVALQFSSQSCTHSSSGDNSGVSIFGVGEGEGVVWTTVICCGALTCGSSTCSVFGASICFSMTGLVVTSCAAGAQLMIKSSAKIAHFICLRLMGVIFMLY